MVRHALQDGSLGASPEVPAEEEEVSGKALDVLNKDGALVRTFSKEVHGKVYQDNAEEFAKKIGGSVHKH